MNMKWVITAFAAAAMGVGLAAFGGSSKAPGVMLAPGQGATTENVTSTAAATPTTTTINTPKSGPLSTEPVVKLH